MSGYMTAAEFAALLPQVERLSERQTVMLVRAALRRNPAPHVLADVVRGIPYDDTADRTLALIAEAVRVRRAHPEGVPSW